MVAPSQTLQGSKAADGLGSLHALRLVAGVVAARDAEDETEVVEDDFVAAALVLVAVW